MSVKVVLTLQVRSTKRYMRELTIRASLCEAARSPKKSVQFPARSQSRSKISQLDCACIARASSAATSGRENCGGGNSPWRNIARTFVPDR